MAGRPELGRQTAWPAEWRVSKGTQRLAARSTWHASASIRGPLWCVTTCSSASTMSTIADTIMPHRSSRAGWCPYHIQKARIDPPSHESARPVGCAQSGCARGLRDVYRGLRGRLHPSGKHANLLLVALEPILEICESCSSQSLHIPAKASEALSCRKLRMGMGSQSVAGT